MVMGTAAVESPGVVRALAERYPGRVAVGLDHRGAGAELAVRGWEQGSGSPLAEVLEGLADVEVGAVVVTAIDRDGMLQGPDLDGLGAVLRMQPRCPWWPRAGCATRRTSRRWHACARGAAAWPVPSWGPPWSKGP